MGFLFDNLDPFMRCYVRGEYLRDLERGQGEFVEAAAYAVRCRRGRSLYFQAALMDPYGGCQFLLPIEALVWRPGAPRVPVEELQPWDCLGDHFSVVELSFVARDPVQILPKRARGEYRFSIDFGIDDLADDPAQHKTLHVVWREDGTIGAYPNNRLLFEDPAWWDIIKERPDFEALHLDARAETLIKPNAIEKSRQPTTDTKEVAKTNRGDSPAAPRGNGAAEHAANLRRRHLPPVGKGKDFDRTQ